MLRVFYEYKLNIPEIKYLKNDIFYKNIDSILKTIKYIEYENKSNTNK